MTDPLGEERTRGWLTLLAIVGVGAAAGTVGFVIGRTLFGNGRPLGATLGAFALALAVGHALKRHSQKNGSARPRQPTPIVVWVAIGAGALLLFSGAATLLAPTMLDRATFSELSEQLRYLPAVAVAILALGVVSTIFGLNKIPPGERRFALEKPGWSIKDKLDELDPGFFFLDTWRELDREALRERQANTREKYDFRPIVIFVTGAIFLSLMEYFGHAPTFRELINTYDPIGRLSAPDTIWGIIRDSPFTRLLEFAWWSGWRVLGFFLLPAFVIKFVLRERVVDHGLQTQGFLSHAWIYVTFFAIMLPILIGVSYEESFHTYYPFYSDASRSWFDFWAWEALYAAQFFSLEFFFRGFWLKAAKRSMGSHAIYAMVVPYCMIHFGKPFQETIAAIGAGVLLGTLALRTRSIWAGFLLHVSVAISMDMLALLHTTGLPERWWPEV